MIVQTLLCGFILFTATFASKGDAETTPKGFNLKDALDKFCDLFLDVYGVKVRWTDMNSNHTEMKKLFATEKFKVQVEMGPITIGETTANSSTRTLLYANLYDNEANASQTYTVTHSTIRKEKSSYITKLGFSLGLELSGGFTIEETLGLSGSVGIKTDRETAKTDTQTKLKTFSVATGVTVPPNRTVKVEWYAITTQNDFVWRRIVTISGYFAMGLERKMENTEVLMVPAYYLALANKNMKIVGPRHASFEAFGIFTAITVPESDIYTADVTGTLMDQITTIPVRARITE